MHRIFELDGPFFAASVGKAVEQANDHHRTLVSGSKSKEVDDILGEHCSSAAEKRRGFYPELGLSSFLVGVSVRGRSLWVGDLRRAYFIYSAHGRAAINTATP